MSLFTAIGLMLFGAAPVPDIGPVVMILERVMK